MRRNESRSRSICIAVPVQATEQKTHMRSILALVISAALIYQLTTMLVGLL